MWRRVLCRQFNHRFHTQDNICILKRVTATAKKTSHWGIALVGRRLTAKIRLTETARYEHAPAAFGLNHTRQLQVPTGGKVLRHAGIPEEDGAHFEHISNVACYAMSWLESVMRKAGCFGRWHLRNNDKHDVQLTHPYPDRVHVFRCLLLSF